MEFDTKMNILFWVLVISIPIASIIWLGFNQYLIGLVICIFLYLGYINLFKDESETDN